MKKNYNQPIVEVAAVFATSLMQVASPLQNSGQGTSTIPSSDPITGN